MRGVRTLLVVLFFTLGIVSSAHAQTGSIAGRVVDAQGAAVASAEVSASSAAQGTRTTRSNAEGAFTFTGLAAGNYVVLVRAPGFADKTEQATVGSAVANVNATLEVAGIVADVTVVGALSGTAATGKTNVPLRDQPLTVQSVPQYVIQEQAANDVATVLQNVPGVYAFTNYGVYEGYTFRGFLDLFPSQANQLIDGVLQQGNRINTQLSNVDRIEVLKGPSSALYGGGAIGATVNIIRKKPSPQPMYDFSAAAGRWGLGRTTFGAGGKLSDRVNYRLDIGAERKDGFRHNDTNRVQFAPSVAWRLGDANQFNVYYTYNRDHFSGDAGIPLLPDGTFPDVARDLNLRTPFDFAHVTDNNLQFAFARQLNNSWGFRNTFSYRPVNDDYLLAEYIAMDSDRDVYREYLQFTHRRRPVTNLAEVTGTLGGRVQHKLVAGWEVQRFANRTDTAPGGGVIDAAGIDLFNPIETQQAPTVTIARERYTTQTTNALYAQDNLTLTDTLKASIGGRFDMFDWNRYDINPITAVTGATTTRDATAMTGRVGLVYQPTPMVDVYGSFATSFRPLTSAQPDGSSLDPERGRQVEVGQRSHLLNDRVQVDTVFFDIVKNNVAFSRPGGVFRQIGEINSRGIEIDLSTSLASNWRINGGYGFTNARFGEYEVDDQTNLKGNHSIMAPRHIVNVWTSYDWASGFGVNVGVRGQSQLFVDDANTMTLGGYGLLNLGARYRRGAFEYALNINNATNSEYFASVLYDTQLYPGDPTNVLGTVRIRLR